MNGRVLIADDNPYVRNLLINIVRNLDLSYDAVCDGQAAWTLIANIHDLYDVLLLDIKMPYFDGTELLDVANKVVDKGSVLIITGDVLDDNELNEARNKTINMHKCVHSFHSKPFENKDIENAIKEIILNKPQKRNVYCPEK